MPATFLLEWTFAPPDLFEERIEYSARNASFVIDAGRADARIPDDGAQDPGALHTELHEDLNAQFLAAQALSHRAYTLTKPKVSRLHDDGRRDAWIFVEGVASMAVVGGTVDFKIQDAAGNVTRDTRKERIEHRKTVASLAAASIDDPAVDSILRSYAAAVSDPRNELIHLYEIREALATQFGGKDKVKVALNISETKWSTLGRLADNEPLREGRHRGEQLGALRDAKKEELETARKIAREMIEAYLAHLGKKAKPPNAP